jgi:hypothetical protein
VANNDLVPIKIPPGFFRNGTNYQAAGRWYDGSLVRWANGRLEPIGGWASLLSGGSTLSGIARNIVTWFDNSGFRYTAVGTNTNLYISQGGGSFDTATPTGLVPGRVDSIEGQGYGAGPYGQQDYGTARTGLGIELGAATWDFDFFGQDLLAVLDSDGKIYRWQPAVGGLATVMDAGAPTGCTGVFVTNELYVMALGAGGNRRTIQWPDEGTISGWTVTLTGTAGSRQLKTAGQILRGMIVGTQHLIWTTQDLHLLEFVGPPDIYANFRVGENCGAIGPRAIATYEGVAEWMGWGAFFSYNGVVTRMPCDVQDYLFGDGSSVTGNINYLQRQKIFAGVNSKKKEVTWFYPSFNSTEVDSYVTHNYEMNVWYFGKLARTCWCDAGVFDFPFAVDPTGTVWQHDTGWLNGTVSRNGQVYITSGPAEIGNGKRVIYAHTMIPDIEITPAAVQLTVTTKQGPQSPALMAAGPYALVPNSHGIVPCRLTGRQASLTYNQVQDAQWSLGTLRFDLSAGGRG